MAPSLVESLQCALESEESSEFVALSAKHVRLPVPAWRTAR